MFSIRVCLINTSKKVDVAEIKIVTNLVLPASFLKIKAVKILTKTYKDKINVF